ncbi:MAG: hypothetical protein JOZ18_04080 [Chloroflexi bacterium]|nr:hypothetical protein [Chloroflexota bacterium]
MKLSRHFFAPIVLALALTLAACGGSQDTGGGSRYGNATNNGATPTTAASGNATTAASTTGSALRTASATVNGKSVTLLTNAQGMTLYYFMPDTATTSACTGGCASTWPPYLSKDVNAPTSDSSLPGKLTVQPDANGNQVEYNGHLLYSYSGDTAPGQTTGEGVGNQWFVATTDLTMSNGSQATPQSTPSKGKYSNGY